MTYAKLHWHKPEYKLRRRTLRREATKAEQVLWLELRAKKFSCKFRRQFQIGKYIVDFCCYQLQLIIELDGPIHEDKNQKKYDKNREKWLQDHGFFVLRFENDEVLFERERVLEDIRKVCCALKTK